MDSMAFVERGVRANVGGPPSRSTVRVSIMPARGLAATRGWRLDPMLSRPLRAQAWSSSPRVPAPGPHRERHRPDDVVVPHSARPEEVTRRGRRNHGCGSVVTGGPWPHHGGPGRRRGHPQRRPVRVADRQAQHVAGRGGDSEPGARTDERLPQPGDRQGDQLGPVLHAGSRGLDRRRTWRGLAPRSQRPRRRCHRRPGVPARAGPRQPADRPDRQPAVGVSPRAVQLGQEARGFALETFLLALSAVVLLRAFRTGRVQRGPGGPR